MRRLRLITLILASVIAMPASAVINYTGTGVSMYMGAVTYAMETLKQSNIEPVNGKKYHKISTNTREINPDDRPTPLHQATSILNISIPVEVYGEDVSVTYMFGNMLLGKDLPPVSTDSGVNGIVVSGGKSGDDMVVYTFSSLDDTDNNLVLSVPFFLIEAPVSQDGFQGSIIVEVKHASSNVTKEYEFTNAVSVVRGVKDDVVEPADLTVSPDTDFKRFTEGTTGYIKDSEGMVGHVGHFGVTKASEALYRAEDGALIQSLIDAESGTPDVGVGLLHSATAEIKGNFDFVESATLSMKMDCAPSLTPMDDEDGKYKYEIEDAGGMYYLCLKLKDDMNKQDPIPDTGPYMATVTYEHLDTVVSIPRRTMDFTLGSISRNETVFRIGFLSLHPQRNHRIHLTNHGRNENAMYAIRFVTEDGVEATAGPAAIGSLPPEKTVVLKAMDVVSVDSGNRVAAVLTVTNARPEDIDVTSSIMNKESGTQVVVEHFSGAGGVLITR